MWERYGMKWVAVESTDVRFTNDKSDLNSESIKRNEKILVQLQNAVKNILPYKAQNNGVSFKRSRWAGENDSE